MFENRYPTMEGLKAIGAKHLLEESLADAGCEPYNDIEITAIDETNGTIVAELINGRRKTDRIVIFKDQRISIDKIDGALRSYNPIILIHNVND